MTSIQESRIVLTDAARAVLEQVLARRPEGLSLVIGNGCCDATAPYLFWNYMAGPNESRVGEVEGVPVFVDRTVAPSFDGTEIVVDARDDPQPDSFSCESEIGWRFVLDRLPAA